MNEVSIIINGVRYDAVDVPVGEECVSCDIYNYCRMYNFPLGKLCMEIPQEKGVTVFQKSTKSFER